MGSQAAARVRLVDVAMRAGVSRATASAVLLGGGGANTRVGAETTGRIRKIAVELGFRANPVARQLKGASSRVIAVLIGVDTPRVNVTRLLEIERQAFRHGYRLMVGHVRLADGGVADYVSDFEGRGIDGLIFLHYPEPAELSAAGAALARIRRLVFLGDVEFPGASCLTIDRADGVRQAVQHLASRGRQRIGLGLPAADTIYMRARRAGYLRGMRDAQLSGQGLIWTGDAGDGTAAPQHIDALIDRLVVDRHADAVIAPDDHWAVQLIKRLKARGLNVPKDVAVVGFDNDDISQAVDPELTTIDTQTDLLAAKAVDLIVATAESTLPSRRQVMVPTKLIVRAST